jgi:hypothetical protein
LADIDQGCEDFRAVVQWAKRRSLILARECIERIEIWQRLVVWV